MRRYFTIGEFYSKKAKHIGFIGFLILFGFTNHTLAQVIIAEDDASNYTTWETATTTNEGFGFGNWVNTDEGGNSGHFRGSSVADVGGDINSDENAFGMFAHSGETAASTLPLPRAMEEGDVFEFQIALNFLGGAKGFDLRNASNDGQLNFNAGDSNDDYRIDGVTLFSRDGANNTVLSFKFTQTATELEWEVVRSGEFSGTETGTEIISPGTVQNIRFYSNNSGNNPGDNFFFNNFLFTVSSINNAPAGATVRLDGTVDETLSDDLTLASIEITDDATFSLATHALTLQSGGSLTNNGTFNADTGNVIFAGSGSVGGSEDVTFHDVEIAGGVVLRGSSTIGNSLTINTGGFLAQTAGGSAITDASNVPDYGNEATLLFAGFFDDGGQPVSGFGTTSDKTPSNVTVLGGARLRLVDYPSATPSIDFVVENGGTLELNAQQDFEHDVTISGVGINDAETDRGAIWKTASGTQDFNGSITLLENSRINVTGGTLDYRGQIDLDGNTLFLGGNQNHFMGAGSSLIGATKQTGDGAFFKDGSGFFQIRPNSNVTGSINLMGGRIQTTGTIPAGGLFRMAGGTTLTSHTSAIRTIEKDLLIEGDVTFGSTVAARNGPLAVSGVVEIEEGASITVQPSANTLTVNSGALFNNQGDKSIDLTIRRELTGFDGTDPLDGEGWRYISSPVVVNLSDLLAPIWTQGLTNTASGNTGAGTPNVYRWNTVTSGIDRGSWEEVTDLDFIISAGEGFLIYVYAANFGDTNPGNNLMLEVEGQEFGSFSVNTNQNDGSDGWTLLGNPYPTSISFEELRASGIEDAVYVWAPNDATGDGGDDTLNPSGSWLAWSSDGTADLGDLTDGLIAPFQAFFVENTDGQSEVSLNFSDAIKSSSFPEFLFKQAPRDVIRMELTGQGIRNSAWLSFSENGSIEQRVSGDAWQLEPMSSDYALLATKKQGIGLMDIAHFPASGDLEIPLITEVTRAGTYHLTVTDFEVHGKDLYLIDLETGESVAITENMRYEFSINEAAKAPTDPFAMLSDDPRKTSVDSHRFVISSKQQNQVEPVDMPEEITLRQNYPNPFNPATVISYDLPEQSHVTLQVYDIMGRYITTLVNDQVPGGQHQVTFDAADLSSGTYIYRLQAGNVVLTRSLTLIK